MTSDNNLLLYRYGQRLLETRKHDDVVSMAQRNRRWCPDTVEIACDNQEQVLVGFALDCCDREAISWVPMTQGIDSTLIGDLIMQAGEYRLCLGKTATESLKWLSDNGSSYKAWAIRTFSRALGIKPINTPVESLQSNRMAEIFIKRFKRDYVNGLASQTPRKSGLCCQFGSIIKI